MFLCGLVPFYKYFGENGSVERWPALVFNNSSPGCVVSLQPLSRDQ